ncbi:MAG: hypothetical protein SVZ03_11495 [Spirochaetota bacterium]|nr:hypothetical protein [Spirochaetota bacterium]
MYEFVRGPMMWITFIIVIFGLVYQIFRLLSVTTIKENIYFTKKIEKQKKSIINYFKEVVTFIFSVSLIENMRLKLRGTILKSEPFLVILTTIFHVCIIITPIFLMGHNILLFQSWNVSLCSFAESTTDILTIIFLLCAFIFLIRRIFVSRVRSVTSVYDYLLLLITIAPFLTGYLAYHQLIDYKTIITIHIIAGELMLISIGLTKLGHMVFFSFVRFFIGSEYSFRGGTRIWK